jgi:hypothetical protein
MSSRYACVLSLCVISGLAACSSADPGTSLEASPPAAGPSAGTATQSAGSPTAGSPTADEPADEPDPEPVEESGPPAASGTNVVLVYAEWDAGAGTVDAGGYVSSVVEDGGECTLALTRGSEEVRVSAPGVADASTTQCGGLSVDGGQLGPGTWSVVLEYQPVDAPSGVSAPLEVTLP